MIIYNGTNIDLIKNDYNLEGEDTKDSTLYVEKDEYEVYKWLLSLQKLNKMDKISYNLHLLTLPKQLRTKYKQMILQGSLSEAIEKKSLSMVKYLIKKGANVSDSHLLSAYENKFDEATKLFIDMGINFKNSSCSIIDESIDTLDAEKVNFIIDNGFEDVSFYLPDVIWSLNIRLSPIYTHYDINVCGGPSEYQLLGQESYEKAIAIYNKLKNKVLEQISVNGINSKKYTKDTIKLFKEIDSKLENLDVSKFEEKTLYSNGYHVDFDHILDLEELRHANPISVYDELYKNLDKILTKNNDKEQNLQSL